MKLNDYQKQNHEFQLIIMIETIVSNNVLLLLYLETYI
jgi:hypothetical protein